MAALYILASVIIVSLISVITAIPFLLKKKVSKKVLVTLMSLSVGTLLGGAFIHLLPEAVHEGYHVGTGLIILLGFLIFFVLEKLVHWHHNKNCERDCGHGHAYHLAPINLIGDGVHNFIDGLVIAGAYIVSIPLGVVATISIIFHEVPQEIADFGVLLYSGYSRMKAVLFNFLSAITAIIGAVIGIMLGGHTEGFAHFIIPFAVGNFVYIGASNLVPELHRHCKIWDTVLHVLAILIGISIMIALVMLFPEHSHS